ncbi:hypothetical protein QKU58_gp027 [Pyramimonas orientalis virus]|uniref:Uncharacterized protein n=1 Tax=Pyramimonas orientalis virus 01B TaxID=3134525 RepID=A0A7M3UNN3_9VIRU|nr:hypothetical protein QKU58_gp027 [Pyramimonas orientalis virus]QOI90304.1 hypothetical protein HWQ62_00167 [Pyramimonas orientalis virus]
MKTFIEIVYNDNKYHEISDGKHKTYASQYEAIKTFYSNVYEASKKVRSIVNFRLGGYKDTDGVINTDSKVKKQFEDLENEKQSVKFNETNYGEYKQILEGDIGEYKVEDDNKIFSVNPDAHFIYAGYGYSGSGKTFSLIQSSKSILNQILTVENENSVELEIFDYYGEINDGQCNKGNIHDTYKKIYNVGDVNEITYYSYVKGRSETIEKSINSHKILLGLDTNVSEIYDELTKFRKDASNYAANKKPFYDIDTIEPARYRVRATPNNPESSRSHLFINVYVKIGDTEKLRYTIIDMGGSEDVDQIESEYFTSKPSYRVVRPNNDTYGNHKYLLEDLDKVKKNTLYALKYNTDNPKEKVHKGIHFSQFTSGVG